MLFEHASWGAGTRDVRLHGTDAVRQAYAGVILYEDGTPRTKHVITNVVIAPVPSNPDQATAASYFTVMQATDSLPLQPIIAGRYEDEFERGPDGAWRFTARIIHPELYGDLSHHMRGPTR